MHSCAELRSIPSLSLPLRITTDIGMLLANRTTYGQLDGHSWAVEHLVRNAFRLANGANVGLGSLVIGETGFSDTIPSATDTV